MEDKSRGLKELSADDVKRLKEIVKEGCIVLQECKDLMEGLNDTIKAIAEEIDVKPSQLKKAITVAHKNTLEEEREKFEILEDILANVGLN